jgi:dCMP deaminase
MATRPTKKVTFLRMARLLSEQSTCARRNVGVIMTDHNHRIVASGYNGNAKGLPHCINVNCAGAIHKSGSALDLCEAIHAEQNALMQCNDINRIHSVYCTTAPCMHCLKMLLNTNAQNIYFLDSYPNMHESENMWIQSIRGRHLEQVKI